MGIFSRMGDIINSNHLNGAGGSDRVKGAKRRIISLHNTNGGITDENSARIRVERTIGKEGRTFANEDSDLSVTAALGSIFSALWYKVMSVPTGAPDGSDLLAALYFCRKWFSRILLHSF